jgi:hypothetical protein
MKKITFLIASLVCATMLCAQNYLYFTPKGWWNNDGAIFNVCLKTSAEATADILTLEAIGDGVYRATLGSTNYTLVRFLRLPSSVPVAGEDTWGDNKTGYMPFSYSEGNHWYMNVECDEGANDKANFLITTYSTEDIVIKFKQAASNTWATVAIYAYYPETFGLWPGATVDNGKLTLVDGWYVVTLPVGTSVGNVIISDGVGSNNGGEQFDATNVGAVSACYEISTSAATVVACSSGTTGVSEVSTTSNTIAGYYTVLGKKLDKAPESGLYIIVYDNGKAEKIVK